MDLTLEISGFRNEPVPNRFHKQDQDTKHLALCFPGLGYTNQMPVMYYPARLLELTGADVLRIDYVYNQKPAYETLSFSGKMQWLAADVTAAYHAALNRRSYEKITLVGKSLGTLAMGHLLATGGRDRPMQCLWLTPLLNNERLRSQIKQIKHKALFVIGTADPFYNADLLKEVETASSGKSIVIPEADHSLEIDADLTRSLKVLQDLIKGLEAFLT